MDVFSEALTLWIWWLPRLLKNILGVLYKKNRGGLSDPPQMESIWMETLFGDKLAMNHPEAYQAYPMQGPETGKQGQKKQIHKDTPFAMTSSRV